MIGSKSDNSVNDCNFDESSEKVKLSRYSKSTGNLDDIFLISSI